ncbi:MAG TPA: glycosyltransferase, partial [Bellilinea sp.]|nr:glycosyltransferase [Bellilinea sp.]
STHTGAGDLFTDGVEGFIVPPRSVDDLLSRLEQLAQDPTLRERMSEAALTRVASIGGWDDYGERWAQRLEGINESTTPYNLHVAAQHGTHE